MIDNVAKNWEQPGGREDRGRAILWEGKEKITRGILKLYWLHIHPPPPSKKKRRGRGHDCLKWCVVTVVFTLLLLATPQRINIKNKQERDQTTKTIMLESHLEQYSWHPWEITISPQTHYISFFVIDHLASIPRVGAEERGSDGVGMENKSTTTLQYSAQSDATSQDQKGKDAQKQGNEGRTISHSNNVCYLPACLLHVMLWLAFYRRRWRMTMIRTSMSSRSFMGDDDASTRNDASKSSCR